MELAFENAHVSSNLRKTEVAHAFMRKKSSMTKIEKDLDTKSEQRLNQILFKETKNSYDLDDED